MFAAESVANLQENKNHIGTGYFEQNICTHGLSMCYYWFLIFPFSIPAVKFDTPISQRERKMEYSSHNSQVIKNNIALLKLLVSTHFKYAIVLHII